MRNRIPALLGGVLAAALTAPAPAHAESGSGTLEVYSAPGVGYESLRLTDGCHTLTPRIVSFADAEPIASYTFYSGPDCTGAALGTGRDDTQWIPPLHGVRSVAIRFEG
ncbi:hypothetical protein [Nocardiopsis trehalosi]|jgi:hypothetical protein|uniref:hypothetical protein n=1 Tax=Nocardiopsis trehalosi TaxID=109329 RepID=UPI00082F8C11|nr:hypothetical protein [Nocardiopsis trehalosi]